MTGARPPRWLKALSVGVGLGCAGLSVRVLTAGPAAAGLPPELAGRVAVLVAVFHLGYAAAPFLAGRGGWPGFFAALLLLPAIPGWLLLFWPGVIADPLLAGLGIASFAVLTALFGYILRDLIGEFRSSRRSGRPD